jgi:putative DNA primase/helicase
MADLAVHIEAVARHLLGPPNKKLSNRRALRFVRERGGDQREAFQWLRHERLVDADDGEGRERQEPAQPPDEPQQYQTLSDWGQQLWASCRPIGADDPAGSYLRARGCALPHRDGDLRWHPALKHPSGHVGPALVGLITDVRDALLPPLNLHRTWLAGDGSGRKATLDRPRSLLKAHHKAGGCIRLWPDDVVTYGLGLAEGVETALTLARVFRPVWSTIDAGNLAAFPYLYPIESITVCVDHDPAGLAS